MMEKKDLREKDSKETVGVGKGGRKLFGKEIKTNEMNKK